MVGVPRARDKTPLSPSPLEPPHILPPVIYKEMGRGGIEGFGLREGYAVPELGEVIQDRSPLPHKTILS